MSHQRSQFSVNAMVTVELYICTETVGLTPVVKFPGVVGFRRRVLAVVLVLL